VAIAVSGPLFIWTDIMDYVAHVQTHNQVFKHLAQLSMVFFGPLYVGLVNRSTPGRTKSKNRSPESDFLLGSCSPG
jgi:hypothetical protein